MKENRKETGLEVAVIGMSGRFPGAACLDEFWNNLEKGRESVTFFTDEELKQAGVEPLLLDNPNYVKALSEVPGKEYFDSSFFGYSPREARVMDPQIRVFHECSWEALEQAGYDPTSYNGSIGVYAGASDNIAWHALEIIRVLVEGPVVFGTAIYSNSAFVSSRISHKLDLTGPCLAFFTACSTSLVAVHLACRALITGECDMALAGGATITANTKEGYVYQEGMIFSPDGHCRTFDARAQGSVFGEGVGVVVLKRLKDAIAAGDSIIAVIKGSSVNNDGMDKSSFTAPSKKRIAELARKALAISQVDPETITYIETHGTATPLGDTIEISALTQAFNTEKKQYCNIGAVKTNIGHLDVAAGVASFIKTVLSLKHKLIPPSLHFETPNPNIDFENSPFKVNTQLSPWENGSGHPLRAAVNSAGIGGTNAFVILEEAPEIKSSSPTREEKILLLSARTESALNQATQNLREYLETSPGVDLADAAYTLQVGRKEFQQRRMLVCSDINDAIGILSTPGSAKMKTFLSRVENREIIFMFSGLGSQYVNMGRGLYEQEPLFREEMDRCFEILKNLVEYDFKEILYPTYSGNRQEAIGNRSTDFSPLERGAPEGRGVSQPGINQTEIAQVVIFILEYALARLIMKWGIRPQAMIGYSFGEYAAACLAGVFSLKDALGLIIYRGQLIKDLPAGLMLSVPLPKDQLMPLLPGEPSGLSIGIDNGPSCIVSGPAEEIAAFEKQMKAKKYLCMRLQVSHALHSTMMAPILEKLKEKAGQVSLNKPQIPFISNVTGTWITAEEVTDPGYWAKHLGGTVQFADGINQLVKKPNALFVEIGPGRDLCALVQRYIDDNGDQHILNLIRHPGKDISDVYFLLRKIGQLWLYGIKIDWSEFYAGEKRHRIPLPTYPFEGQSFHMEGSPFQVVANLLSKRSSAAENPDLANWFYIQSWKRSRWSGTLDWQALTPAKWLIFIDQCGLGQKIGKELEKNDHEVIIIRSGAGFSKVSDREYTVNPARDNDYHSLLAELKNLGNLPRYILHLWCVTGSSANRLEVESVAPSQDRGFYSLINMARAVGKLNISNKLRIAVVTDNMQEVIGEDRLDPLKATVIGPVKGIPTEYNNISLSSIDILLPTPGSDREEKLLRQILKEAVTETTEPIMAIRDNLRWVEIYEPLRLENPQGKTPPLRDKGVYLVTGGLGGIGLTLAEYLARKVSAGLVLVGRSPFPARDHWEQWLDTHSEDDNTSRKIRKIQQLESLGAKVSVFSADVTNQGQMQEVVEKTEQQLGNINGIIHAAGAADGTMIQLRTREISEEILSPKVRGTVVLDTVFRDREPDFFILCSSVESMLTSPGQVGYCAANNFLDAFSRYRARQGNTFTLSVNWPRWKGVGIAVIAENLHKELTGKDLHGGLTTSEGVQAFERLLLESLSSVVVVKQDLRELIKYFNDLKVSSVMEILEETVDTEHMSQRPEIDTEYAAPVNETQETLARVWARAFGFDRVGIHDDFFELGGDSLKALIVSAKIQKELNVEVPIQEFFSRPTIEGLCQYIELNMEAADHMTLEPVEEKEYYELSSAQKRLYVVQLMDSQSTTYNIPTVVTLEGEIDTGKIDSIFKQLIARHEALRTSFRAINGKGLQQVHREVEFEIEFYNSGKQGNREIGNILEDSGKQGNREIGNILEDSGKQADREIGNEEDLSNTDSQPPELSPKTPVSLSPSLPEPIKNFIRPFDLSRAPLLRVGMIKMAEKKHILMADVHHIVADGISTDILVKEFIALYRGEDLPVLKMQYKDFSAWQNKLLESKEIKKQEAFWLDKFKGNIPRLNMPLDYERPAVKSFAGDRIHFEIAKDPTFKIKQLNKETGTTLFMVLLAVYNVLLHKYTGQTDIIIGSPISGRRHVDMQNLLGVFVNMIAFRNQPGPGKSFAAFLEEVKANAVQGYQNQDYQFEELVRKLGLQGETARSPIFDVAFALQQERESEYTTNTTIKNKAKEDGLLKVTPYDAGNRVSRFDLLFEAVALENKIVIDLEYSTQLFKKSSVEIIGKHFNEILDQVLADKEIKLENIAVSSDLEVVKSDHINLDFEF